MRPLPFALAALTALALLLTAAAASAQHRHPHPPWVEPPIWIEPPILPVWDTDDVIRVAEPQIVDCMGGPVLWERRHTVVLMSVNLSITADRHGRPVVVVAAVPQDRRVERCAYEVLSAHGFYDAPLGNTLVWTISRPIPVDPWPMPPILPPPPPPPPIRPPPLPPRIDASAILLEAPWRIDACRLGPPDGARWTVRFTIDPDGRAREARAEPRDEVGECLEDLVERTGFERASTRGSTSVTLQP
jgi:hypothetical protein